jgi:sialate O-acetylesterase
MRKIILRLSAALLALLLSTGYILANVSLPEIFGSNMVLQQKSDVTFWGWAKAGEKVTINAGWLGEGLSATASTQGEWKIVVKTPAAGGPYDINIKGHNVIELTGVMIGEVWLCSGQSNMEWSAQSGIDNGEEEIKNANYPDIRLFTVSSATAGYPQQHFTGSWTRCSPETMKSFSAIGYFFARKLHHELGVPVGVINSSWGGTPAESWMPGDVIENDPFLKEAAAKQKPVPWGPVEPARLYNAMIHPMIPFRIAGVLWYQGEANTVNAYAYKALLENLIKSWRAAWGYEFPFYYAQIAPFSYGRNFDGVMVRDAQRRVLEMPKTGMAVLSDICDTAYIHPRNKQDAALRLAYIALRNDYGMRQYEGSGPLYKDMVIDKNKAIISFDNSEGLHSDGKKPDCFEIAGKDMVFHPAEARIEGEKVIVQSRKVKDPVAVRFAWSNTATPNLFNGANLPASCFTTEK